jgi:hypothetical protein
MGGLRQWKTAILTVRGPTAMLATRATRTAARHPMPDQDPPAALNAPIVQALARLQGHAPLAPEIGRAHV